MAECVELFAGGGFNGLSVDFCISSPSPRMILHGVSSHRERANGIMSSLSLQLMNAQK